MSAVIENGKRARAGNSFEKLFSEKTGIGKLEAKLKPQFKNEHGNSQKIDSDFCLETESSIVFFDLTTSLRTDRAKQKAYNALCYKSEIFSEKECKFYVVVPDDDKNFNKRKNPVLLHGLDGVICFTEAVEIARGGGNV